MTRERAKELAPIIAAYGDGKEIESRFLAGGWSRLEDASWLDGREYRIKPSPKMRPMTRGEVLYMVTTTPAMVTRCIDAMYPAPFTPLYDDDFQLSDYEYAIIDKHGEPVDGWKKFEIEIDE